MKILFRFLSVLLLTSQTFATNIQITEDDLTVEQHRRYAHLPLCLRAKAVQFNTAWQNIPNHLDDDPLTQYVQQIMLIDINRVHDENIDI